MHRDLFFTYLGTTSVITTERFTTSKNPLEKRH